MKYRYLYSSETKERVNFTVIIDSACKTLTETAFFLSKILQVHMYIYIDIYIYMYVYPIQKLTNKAVYS